MRQHSCSHLGYCQEVCSRPIDVHTGWAGARHHQQMTTGRAQMSCDDCRDRDEEIVQIRRTAATQTLMHRHSHVAWKQLVHAHQTSLSVCIADWWTGEDSKQLVRLQACTALSLHQFRTSRPPHPHCTMNVQWNTAKTTVIPVHGIFNCHCR